MWWLCRYTPNSSNWRIGTAGDALKPKNSCMWALLIICELWTVIGRALSSWEQLFLLENAIGNWEQLGTAFRCDHKIKSYIYMWNGTQNGRWGYCAKYVGTADPVCMGRKSCQYNYISGQEYSCIGMTFCPYRLNQLYASSAILLPILYIKLCLLW